MHRLISSRPHQALLVASWIVLLLLYVNLFGGRSTTARIAGRYSVSYTLALGAGLLALVVSARSTLWPRGSEARGDSAARAPSPRDRIIALAGWPLLVAAVSTRLLWWFQRPWQLRLFVCFALVDWSLLWLARAREQPAWSSTRSWLLGAALLLLTAALQGLSLGVSGFSFWISVIVMAAALLMASGALTGSAIAVRNTLTIAGSTMVTLAVMEGALRGMHVAEGLMAFDDPTYVRQFHHNTAPRSAFIRHPQPLDEFPPVLIETNSLGMRGPELRRSRVDILLLGDSFIQAQQIAWEQTVTPRLQSALEGRGLRAAVASHGVLGWSPLLEWNWYLKVGRQLHPKVVLLFFFWNDLWIARDEAADYRAVLTSSGRPAYFDLRIGPRWLWFRWLRTFQLVEYTVQRLGELQVRRLFNLSRQRPTTTARDAGLEAVKAQARRMAAEEPLESRDIEHLLRDDPRALPNRLRPIAQTKFWPSMRPRSLWTTEQRNAAASSERILRLFAEDVQADSGRLVVVYVTNPLQVSTDECAAGRYFDRVDDATVLPPTSGLQDWLADVCRRYGLEFLDPTAAMRARHRAGAPPLHLRADCHWSPAGHRFMAEYLASWYAERRRSIQLSR
ncbi:MAG: hypothetical protein HYX76_10425 [Acidobacteria bacterium]|nr:hypothetical protein [Acidobacteriota bacterium]